MATLGLTLFALCSIGLSLIISAGLGVTEGKSLATSSYDDWSVPRADVNHQHGPKKSGQCHSESKALIEGCIDPCPPGQRCGLKFEGGRFKFGCKCRRFCFGILGSGPVCGSDGKTYKSECHLGQKACWTESDVTKVSEGRCPSGGESTSRPTELPGPMPSPTGDPKPTKVPSPEPNPTKGPGPMPEPTRVPGPEPGPFPSTPSPPPSETTTPTSTSIPPSTTPKYIPMPPPPVLPPDPPRPTSRSPGSREFGGSQSMRGHSKRGRRRHDKDFEDHEEALWR